MSESASVSVRVKAIIDEVETVIVGKTETIKLALVGLLCQGHILVEDIPGVGKTMLAKSIAKAISCQYKRIQFTPDLLPADITGVSVFNQKTGEFQFRQGPIFANVVLADEINRATPKTQSSLLECMDEFQVTVDGITYSLPPPFFVIATENPIEYHGTYPLPEAQLDRFLMRVRMGYPQIEEEITILNRQMKEHPIVSVKPVIQAEELPLLQSQVREIYLEDSLKGYMVQMVTATRNHPAVALGASPRGSLALMRCSQAWAAIEGREFVAPDDIKLVAEPVLTHRLILKPEGRVRGISAHDIVSEILSQVPVPSVETIT